MLKGPAMMSETEIKQPAVISAKRQLEEMIKRPAIMSGKQALAVPSGQQSGHRNRPPPDAASVRQDYTGHRFCIRERIRYLSFYIFLDGCVSFLFFNSWIAFFLLLPGAAAFLAERRSVLQKRREKVIRQQFLDGIQMMSASLQAGYSPENALSETLPELRKVYEPDAVVIREFTFMEAQISVGRNLEELFMDFGRRCAAEDIQSFAEVFLSAKRSGGDLLAIVRNTVSCIRQKQETMQEIETCLAGKLMEQKIMSMVPILILAYIRLSSPEFMSLMYGNAAGTAIMTLCFLIYALAYFWGRKIVQIEV